MAVRSARVNPATVAGALTAGDAVTGLFELPLVASGKAAAIQTITVIDTAEQSAALELIFFDRAVTAAAPDAAVSYTDADLKSFCLGVIEVAAADYSVELGGAGVQSVATLRDVNFYFDVPFGVSSIWCQVRTTGTPTYGATDALSLLFVAVDVK